VNPLFFAWACFCVAAAAFYAHLAITGRTFRDWPALRGGGPMSRGYAAFTAINFMLVLIAGVLFFPW